MSSPSISLIIAVYNRVEALEMIFTALTRQTFTDFEIIVADDGSGPSIAALISSWQHRFACPLGHVWHEDNGFRKTIIVNKAISVARGGYLVFMDGDCIPHRLFLQDHWDRRETGAVLTGRRLMMSEKATKSFTLADVQNGRYERPLRWLFNLEFHTVQYAFRIPWIDTIRNRRKSDYFVLGCNFSLHKKDFIAVNGYDERIIERGLEDNNLHARFLAGNMPMRSISQVALQYHLYHYSGPIPHSGETVEKFCAVTSPWTEFGIVKRRMP
jgi:glycosyltransferase involved in cell wall biosynthesis